MLHHPLALLLYPHSRIIINEISTRVKYVLIVTGVTGVEWPKIWNDLKLKHGGLAFCLQSQVAILKNGEFLGGDTELKEFVNTRYLYTVYLDYYKEGIRQFSNSIQSSGVSQL